MATGITLAEAVTNLANAQTALAAARNAQSYSISDRQVSRGALTDLEREVHHWSRMVREMTDAAADVENPHFLVPKWT